jgi:hypothetical protein
MVAVHSEGGGVEVDSGSTSMTKSLRKRMAVACSEAGIEAVACSRARDEAVACFGAGIEDSRWWWRGTVVSMVTAERERV